MGRNLKDISGQTFNGILIKSLVFKATNSPSKWLCECHCGNEFITTSSRITSNKTKSCGCKRYHYKFIIDRPTYNSYCAMLDRCTNIDSANYEKYGKIGITVCDRWLEKNPAGFNNFVEDMGIRPEEHSINRINSAKIYSKDTCEWANYSVQSYDQNIRKDNPSGISGVAFRTERNKWTAGITADGKDINLYYGDSKEEAIKCRKDAEILYFGRFKNA